MTQRKKFLYAGLSLNLLFFFGAAFAISGSLIEDRRYIYHQVLTEFSKLQNQLLREEEQKIAATIADIEKKEMGAKELATIVAYHQIVSIYKWQGDTRQLVHRSSEENLNISHLSEFLKIGISTQVFHRGDGEDLFLSYLLMPKQYPELKEPHLVTVKRTHPAVPAFLGNFKSGVTLLQKEGAGANAILASTLNKELAEKLRADFVLPGIVAENTLRTMSIGDGKYLLVTMGVVFLPDFFQAVVYSFKWSDFVLFDATSAAVFMLALFCLGCGITIMAYMWTAEKN